MFKKILLPYKYRFVGYAFLLIGLAIVYVRFYLGIKPGFLTLPVFAIYSSFLETKTFQFITNNIAEEISSVFILAGLILIGFSEIKSENENTNLIRFKSLIYSVYLNTFLLFLTTIFVYGFGFITVLIINMISQIALYIIIFKTLLFLDKKQNSSLEKIK